MKNGKSTYVLMEKVIMHATTAKMIVTARHMHIWHKYLAMTNGKFMARLKMRQNTCARGVIEKWTVYGTRDLYD